MDFRIEQPIAASRTRVIAALADPDFYIRRGESEKVRPPEILERTQDGHTVRLSIRYSFTGDLSGAASAMLDPSQLTWVVETDLSTKTGDAVFRLRPDHYADRLSCDGAYRLVAHGRATTQELDGHIKVRVPIVNRAVENAIVQGLREHLADQAAELADWRPAAS